MRLASQAEKDFFKKSIFDTTAKDDCFPFYTDFETKIERKLSNVFSQSIDAPIIIKGKDIKNYFRLFEDEAEYEITIKKK